ncbi:S-layer family protein [Beijerinckia sp. L45]|uniref:beta strand repeat-containing protein n=1 Tax=Beijerinckia sp. L45 TaxID=1641855 RepID=UPI00131BE95D|nr:Ig-like domain-containing protein [Beijerinckia sp. L45]
MANETVFTFTSVPLNTLGLLPLSNYSGAVLVNYNTGTVTGSITVAPILNLGLTTYTSFTITQGLGGSFTITGTGLTASLVSSTITIQYTGAVPTTVNTQYNVLGVETGTGTGGAITTAAALEPSVVPETASVIAGATVTATAANGALQGDSDPNGGTLSVTSVTSGGTTDPITAGGSATIAGTDGTLTLNSDGSYSYVASNGLAIVSAADGSPITDTFSYVVNASGGASSNSSAAFTVGLGAAGIEAVANLSDATAPARFLNLGATRMNVTQTTAGTYSGVIRDGSSGNVGGILSVSGTAALTLTGVSTYTGKTAVFGILNLGSGSSIAASRDVKMNFGGVFDISGDDQLNGVTIGKLKGPGGTVELGSRILIVNPTTAGEFDGVITDGGASGGVGGALKIDGTAPLLLTGVSTYTGKTALFGTLELGAGSSIAASKNVKMNAGGVFDISADTGGATIKKLKGLGGTVELGAQTLTVNTPTNGEFDGTITDGGIAGGTGGVLNLAGVAGMLLTGSSSYSGGTILNGGTSLELDAANAAGTGAITFNGAATLKLDAPALTPVSGSVSNFGNVIAGMGTGDAVDLASLAFSPGSTATYSNGVLTTTAGGNSVTLHLTGVNAGTQFAAAADGTGGTVITQTAVTPGAFVFTQAPTPGAGSDASSGDLAPSPATTMADVLNTPTNSASSAFTPPPPAPPVAQLAASHA